MKDVQMIELKKKVVELESGKYMGISSMYNFRCDQNLGIRNVDRRQIRCACLTWLEMLKTPWDKELNNQAEPRYGINKRSLYWRSVKGYNN